MEQDISRNIKMMVFSSLFTALIIVGSYISFPLPFSPVPIVLSNFFIILAGVMLGKWWGFTSVMLYLFLGIIGLPVFAGGKGGIAILLGPTGGFLLSFPVAAFVIGVISHQGKKSIIKDGIALLIGTFLIIYGFGVPWLKFVLKVSWSKAFAIAMLPYLIGDAFKAGIALVLTKLLRPLIERIAIVKNADVVSSS